MELNYAKKILDDESFIEISELFEPSVHIGYGTINSKLVYLIVEAGSIINKNYVEKITSLYDKAIQMGAPVLYFIDNNGIDIKDSCSLSYYGKILEKQSLASGVVPQIGIITGNCGGGMSIIANSCDFLYIDKSNGKMWTIPPISIDKNINNDLSMANNVQKTMLVDNILDTENLYVEIRELMKYLPSNFDDDDYVECDDDLNRATNDFTGEDTIHSIKDLADNNNYLEIKTEYGKGITTGFIKLNGQTIAVVGNVSKEKRLCKNGLKKINKFITFADSFSIPILTIADVLEFKKEDNDDLLVSIPASKVAFSYVNATVPKVTLVKNAVGVPGLIMGSKSLNVDLVFAFDDSNINIMNERVLAEILYDSQLEEAEDKLKFLDEKTKEIKVSNNSKNAAANNLIDNVISNNEVRQMTIAAFEMLFTKRVNKINKKHGAF